MSSYIEQRREETRRRFEELRAKLGKTKEIASDQACVYVTGSFGREEASSHSDLDLFIVGRMEGPPSQQERALSRLDEICIKADLIDATRAMNIQEFSGDGEYLVHHTVDELVKTLGHPNDDASNTFTARLLLLLESKPLVGDDVYSKAIDEVIEAYWGDYVDHKGEFVPAFLANDILRLWRTFCVNYEARTRTAPSEEKAKRKLKNYKLKHSRLLTCYSALAYLLAVFAAQKTVTPEDAREMVSMTPMLRLEAIVQQFGVDALVVDELSNAYERFLGKTDCPERELAKQLTNPATSREFFDDVNKFGDLVWKLLEKTGKGTHIRRLLLV